MDSYDSENYLSQPFFSSFVTTFNYDTYEMTIQTNSMNSNGATISAKKGGSSGDDSLSTGAIVGICIGGVVVVALIAGGIVYMMKKRGQENEVKETAYDTVPLSHD